MTPSKSPVSLSDRAEADREGIALYGIETWGEERAARYIAKLDRAIDGLSDNPNIGAIRDDLRAGVRGRPMGQHVIYYIVGRDRILVGRILHTRQDAAAAAGLMRGR